MDDPKLVPELLCSDISKSLKFYVGVLEFQIFYERPEEGFAYLNMDGAHLMLEEATEDMDRDRVWWTAKPAKPYGRGINLQIEVPDVDRLCKALGNCNYPLFRPIEEKWYRKDMMETGVRQFLVQDPDGYLLRFCSDIGERPVTL